MALRPRGIGVWFLAVAAANWCASWAGADVFVLRNGGQVRGRWLNRDERPLRHYAIATEHGGELVLDATQVRQAIPQTEAGVAYESLARKAPNTVAGQWELAEWCREHNLSKQRQVHLRRILELEPDHFGARRALGYVPVAGRWLTREELQIQRGFELSGGRWRYPQEIELTERQQAAERAEKDWLLRLRRCRECLYTDKGEQARQEIAKVRDPLAVKALAQLLSEERNREVKWLYLEVLAEIRTPEAVQTLFHITLADPDEEVFQACLDKLLQLKPPNAVKQYVPHLKDPNNVRLNRAAYALGRLGDPTVLSPLIDALVTTHYTILPAKSDAYTAIFSPSGASPYGSVPLAPGGGTGFSAGDDRQVIPHNVANQEVLQALIRLSGGVNLGFDKKAWQAWLAHENRQATPLVKSRRDAEP